jgi:hypothetical protein
MDFGRSKNDFGGLRPVECKEQNMVSLLNKIQKRLLRQPVFFKNRLL